MPSRALAVLLQNPFASAVERGEPLLAELPQLTRSVLERLAGLHSPEEVWLAVMHARALSGETVEALLKNPLLNSRPPLTAARRARFARVAVASARCVEQLSVLHGKSALMQRVRHDVWAACFGASLLHGALLERVVRDHDVLIAGETGTGKELVARAIAEGSPSSQGEGPTPFAEINAAAVPDALVESELFGHTKGAFTGANDARMGLIRTAHGGCLFLDEVADLPLSAQAKLLRVIETDIVQPVGSDRPYAVDVRFLAASHRDLAARVQEGAFRADLYQRLAGVVIRLPALRERPEDIPVIGTRFVEEALAGIKQVDSGPILRWLASAQARKHAWPGNVRQLRNVLRNLLLGLPSGLTGETDLSLSPSRHLPARIRDGQASLHEVEAWYVAEALKRAGGNVAAAARVLGIDRTTLQRKL